MKPSQILALCKYSKLEYDKLKFNLTTRAMIKKYNEEHIQHEMILDSHIEQKKCKILAKKLLKGITFLNTPEITKEDTKDKDLLISIGGDEHFKFLIHNSYNDRLFLNVRSDNLKSEGALSTCNRFDLDIMVDQIYNDSYKVEHWVRLDAFLNGKQIESAIDTIFIGEKNGTRMSRYFFQFRGNEEEQKSSGLLVVTGAGSTGWYTSAGGIAFPRNDNKGKFLAREIYKGTRTGFSMSQGEFYENEEINVFSLSDEGGIIEVDSIKEYPFMRGDHLKVKVSKEYLNVMILNKD